MLASAAALTPRFLYANSYPALSDNNQEEILVVIQLSGGNDGINTVVPYADDNYHKLRPGLSLGKNEIIRINDRFGFHAALSPLQQMMDSGDMSVLNRIGYPNPDRSHFRSMDIWHSASNSNEFWGDGWIGRFIDSSCTGCSRPHLAIELDDALSLALKGKKMNGLAVSDPARLKKALSGPLARDLMESLHTGTSNTDYLYKILTDTGSSVDYLFEHSRGGHVAIEFPSTGFSKDLRMVATLINSGCETRIYYVSLSGFDTHNNQKNRQERLLKEYAEGVEAFYREMKRTGNWKRTLVMTFSEFGRRVEQNASGGTDHGKANCLFLIGGAMRSPGLHAGEYDLSLLDDGDLKYETDFRSVYASVLQNWLKADSEKILGRKFELIQI